ncbi:uncharacterized protein V6R79_004275 [Siganus canaliculatus]
MVRSFLSVRRTLRCLQKTLRSFRGEQSTRESERNQWHLIKLIRFGHKLAALALIHRISANANVAKSPCANETAERRFSGEMKQQLVTVSLKLQPGNSLCPIHTGTYQQLNRPHLENKGNARCVTGMMRQKTDSSSCNMDSIHMT